MTMGNIDWVDIAELPEAFKDGRNVLLWTGFPVVDIWLNDGWADSGNRTATHFAEINPPE
jgi:hypothetical protein